MEDDDLRLEGGIARLELGRGLDAGALLDRDDIRVVVLSGAFTANVPVDQLHALVRALEALDAPVVAAVAGPATGTGFALVCAADIVIAGRSATFAAGFVDEGLVPVGGCSWTLPRLVGYRRASELLLAGGFIDATTAERIGLVTTTVDDEQLVRHADGLAVRMACGSRQARAAVRWLLRSSATSLLEDQLDFEADTVIRLAARESRSGA